MNLASNLHGHSVCLPAFFIAVLMMGFNPAQAQAGDSTPVWPAFYKQYGGADEVHSGSRLPAQCGGGGMGGK